jgi:hypothetical protein
VRMRFPFQSNLLVGASSGRSRAGRLSARSGWITLILWPLLALSAPCRPPETQTPSPQHQAAVSALSEQGGAIADLDGDGRPDLVMVRPTGWGPRGFQYQVELDLTTHRPSSPLSVSAEQGGLRVVARDVDGDGDLDLVIKSASSLTPVGVWINDGYGRFTRGDPAAYPRSIWTEGPGILSDSPKDTLQAALPQSYRFCLDVSLPSYFHSELTFEHPPVPFAGAQPSGNAVTHPSTRAPPPSFRQQSS